ncbi:MAG: J domain-containing protein [Pseudomonadota bacterium]
MTDVERAFAILGVSPTDDAATIRKAWRALVRSYHPDTARTDPAGANKRLTEINVAFDAVSACSAEDLAKLKVKRAENLRRAERLRAEKRRQEQARLKTRDERRRAQEVAREAEAKAARTAAYQARSVKFDEKRKEKTQNCRAGSASASCALVPSMSKTKRSEGRARAQSLAARAEKGFIDAMKACALQTILPTRSCYA